MMVGAAVSVEGLAKQRLQRVKRARTGVAQAAAGHINGEDGEALIISEKVKLNKLNKLN